MSTLFLVFWPPRWIGEVFWAVWEYTKESLFETVRESDAIQAIGNEWPTAHCVNGPPGYLYYWTFSDSQQQDNGTVWWHELVGWNRKNHWIYWPSIVNAPMPFQLIKRSESFTTKWQAAKNPFFLWRKQSTLPRISWRTCTMLTSRESIREERVGVWATEYSSTFIDVSRNSRQSLHVPTGVRSCMGSYCHWRGEG